MANINKIVPRHFNFFAKTQTLNHIHNNNLQHRWWWASNGWSVKVCTDEQVWHAHISERSI